MSLEERILYLEKEYWSNSDIKDYFGLTDSVAKRVKKSIKNKMKQNDYLYKVPKEYVFEELDISYETIIATLKYETKFATLN